MLRGLTKLCLLAAGRAGAVVAALACEAGGPSATATCSSGGSFVTPAPSDVDDVGLLAHSVRRHKADKQVSAECAATTALLAAYGSDIGSQGELFGLGKPDLFYTWSDFLSAVCMSDGFLVDANMQINGLTLVAIMANLQSETLHWTACKERVRMANGTCPCVYPACSGGCSGGLIDSYTSAKASAAGFRITTCGGAVAPSKGCVDFWGKTVEDPKNCWWGRGATQLTWPGNYDQLQAKMKAATEVDICADPDRICDSDTIAWATAIAYWQMNSGPWDAAHTFESSLLVIRPADSSSNAEREKNFNAWAAALGLHPPTPAPRKEQGTTTVQPEEGCWQITERVCGPGRGKDYKTVICDPKGCSPSPGLGQTVTYNCNGC